MEKNNILFLIVGLLIGLIAIKAGPMIIMGFNTMNVTLTGTTGNTGPSVDSVSFNDGGAITLSAGTTTTINCTSVVSDPNGGEDFNIANSYMMIYYKYYNPPAEGSATTNYNYAYYNNTLWNSTTYDTTKKNITATFDIQYFAAPGEWVCFVKISDTEGSTANSTATASISSLNSLDTDSTINFGSLTVGVPSNEITHAVRNWGNIMTDLALNGTDMTCSTLGSIPVADIKYNVSQSGIAYGSMTALSGSQTTSTHFDLAKKTLNDTTTNSTKNTYWKVQAPSGAKGTCTGTAQFTSVSGDYTFGSAAEVSGFTNGTRMFYSQNPTTNMYYRLVVDYVNNTNNDLKFYNSTDGVTWSSAVVVETGVSWLDTNSPVLVLTDGLGIVYSDNKTANNTYQVFFKKSTDDGATWSAATQLSADGKNNSRPAAVVDSTGNIYVVWEDWQNLPRTNPTPGASDLLVGVNSTNNGTNWSTAAELLTIGDSSINYALQPTLTIDADNNCYLIYTTGNGFGGSPITMAFRNSSNCGSWSEDALSVSGQTNYNEWNPMAIVDKDGTIWIAYELWYPTKSVSDAIAAYVRSYDDGATWDVPRKIVSEDFQQAYPTLGKMNNGDIWTAYLNESAEMAKAVVTYTV